MLRYVYVSVFISGMTSLALEMSASRLLGNVFGTSNLVWASIIGLVMIYLAAGYFLGGRWADRSKSFKTFFLIQLWASLAIAIIPVVSRPVLRLAANAFDELSLGIMFGSFSAVLVLLSVPTILLGTISPFAIKLTAGKPAEFGTTAGRISGISTLGSFIGTFTPVLILIPLIGTSRSFLVYAGLLLLVAWIGLWRYTGLRTALAYIWAPFLILALYLWGLPGGEKSTSGMIHESESAYNYIQVLENNQFRFLRLNEGQGMHSIYHPTILDYAGPWEQVLAAPFFNLAPYDPSGFKSLAIVGLAAGTTARQATEVFGSIEIDGYEIDPVIVDVARQYFGMNMPNLNVIVQDGRWGLERSTRRYQVISLDAYRPPYIPWYLTTKEFFTVVRDHLTSDGVATINVGRAPSDRILIDILVATAGSVFPTIHVVDIPNTFNSVIFATVQPTTPENLIRNYQSLTSRGTIHPLLQKVLQTSIRNIQPPARAAVIYTDDHAPIEWITNSMVLKFLLSEEVEKLQ